MPEDMGLAETEVSGAMSESENEYDELDASKDDDDKMAEQNLSPDANGDTKKKYDPKDPSRPRRKKARRACFACQRAHLTCGKHKHPLPISRLDPLRPVSGPCLFGCFLVAHPHPDVYPSQLSTSCG